MLTRLLDLIAPRDGKWSKVLVPAVFMVAAVSTKLHSGPAAADPGPVFVVIAITAVLGLAIGVVAAKLPRTLCAVVLVAVVGLSLDIGFSIEHNATFYVRRHWTMSLWVEVLVIACVLAALPALALVIAGVRRWQALLVAGIVYLVALVAFPISPPREIPEPTVKTEAPAPLGRLVVEVLLDEHVGLAGIPTNIAGGKELRESLAKFYVSHGFRLFSEAYTAYPFTAISVPSMLGLDDPEPEKITLFDLQNRWLHPMAWFQRIKDAGYHLLVYSIGADHNLCTYNKEIDDCRIYDPATHIPEGNFRTRVRQYILATAFQSVTGELLCSVGITCSTGSYNNATNSVRILDQVTREISMASGDTAIFVHAILPHPPVRVGADCRVIYIRSTSSPAELIERYFDQVRCSMRMVDKIVAAVDARGALDRATIIVHGDHGLRLTRGPQAGVDTQLIAHSALFAIRAPGIEAGIDTSFNRVQSLIPRFIVDRPLPPPDPAVWLYRPDPNSRVRHGTVSFPPPTTPQ